MHEDLTKNWTVVKATSPPLPCRATISPTGTSITDDPEESSIGAIVRGVIFIADTMDAISKRATTYQSLGGDSVVQIRRVLQSSQPLWLEENDPKGVPYLIREFYVYDSDDHTKKFFVAIGTSLAAATRTCSLSSTG